MMRVVIYSSCESEYVGLSESGNEVVHLQQLQGELGIGKKGVLLMGDNIAEARREPRLSPKVKAHPDQVSFSS